MAFPSYSDIVASTLENRSSEIADAVTKNNAAYYFMKKNGRIKTFDGGRTIMTNLAFAENGNASWYSGYDELPVSAQDVLTAAEFPIKQLACPVTMSGLEDLQNSGKEQVFDLMEARIDVAESTLTNMLTEGFHSDGTGYGGKTLTGVGIGIPVDPTTGTYGGINRANWTVWRSKYSTAAVTSTTILAAMNTFWASLTRGSDHPDLLLMGDTAWGKFLGALQPQQRFENPELANVGFTTLKYMNATVALDGGIGGFIPTGDIIFLNTKYMWLRPHARRNMVPIPPKQRSAVNQDASVTMLGWAGNLVQSNPFLQGRFRTT